MIAILLIGKATFVWAGAEVAGAVVVGVGFGAAGGGVAGRCCAIADVAIARTIKVLMGKRGFLIIMVVARASSTRALANDNSDCSFMAALPGLPRRSQGSSR